MIPCVSNELTILYLPAFPSVIYMSYGMATLEDNFIKIFIGSVTLKQPCCRFWSGGN